MHTQVGWEAEEAVHSSGMDSHSGTTVCGRQSSLGGVIAPAWLCCGCTSKALLLCHSSIPARTEPCWLWGSKLVHPSGRALQ